MPLVQNILPAARKGRYAVPSFNVVTLDMIDGVFRAAEIQHAPVIIGIASRHLGIVDPWLIAGAVLKRAARSSAPIVFHLDHAESLEAVQLGIEIGCNSVMIDGSKLPYEENLELTQSVTRYAHSKNVSVEAELGPVGGVEGEIQGGESPALYTDPAQAAEFARQTEVDALAIAIGTVHGLYRRPPNLQFDILKKIAQKTDIPLVLHGGTGLSAESFGRLIDEGISKVNIFTELSLRCADRLRRNLNRRSEPVSITDAIEGLSEELEKVASGLIVTFRCAGRG